MTEAIHSDRVKLFMRIVDALNNTGCEWCAVSGHRELPARIESDVDIVMRSGQGEIAMRAIAALPDVDVINSRKYRSGCIVYSICAKSAPTAIVQLDIASDIRAIGRVLFNADDILRARVRSDTGLFRLSPAVEFAYYFVKKIYKSAALTDPLTSIERKRLSDLYAADPEGARTELSRFLPEHEIEDIDICATSGDWAQVAGRIAEFRKSLRRHRLSYWIAEMARFVQRMVRPTGFMVVVLGPYGSGTSTIIESIDPLLHGACHRADKGHFKNMFDGDEQSRAAQDPYAQSARGSVMSIARLVLWWFQFQWLWWRRIYPALVRSSFVLFDRYFDDIGIDPRRYRYGGPRWAFWLAAQTIPGPHAFIVLDADETLLHQRKREISLDDIAAQVRKYRAFGSSNQRAINADFNSSSDLVVESVEIALIEAMIPRAIDRLSLSHAADHDAVSGTG